MSKKLTKKQIREIEEKEKTILTERRLFVESIRSYWEDVNATTRYYKINKMKDKLNYYGNINDNEELQNLINRYDILKDLGIKSTYDDEDPEYHTWSIIRFITNTEDHKKGFNKVIYNGAKFETEIERDDIYVEDILWGEKDVDLLIKYMKKFGYKRIQYFCHSSGVNEDLYYFVSKGCKITGTNAVLRKPWHDEEYKVDKTGLIIEI